MNTIFTTNTYRTFAFALLIATVSFSGASAQIQPGDVLVVGSETLTNTPYSIDPATNDFLPETIVLSNNSLDNTATPTIELEGESIEPVSPWQEQAEAEPTIELELEVEPEATGGNGNNNGNGGVAQIIGRGGSSWGSNTQPTPPTQVPVYVPVYVPSTTSSTGGTTSNSSATKKVAQADNSEGGFVFAQERVEQNDSRLTASAGAAGITNLLIPLVILLLLFGTVYFAFATRQIQRRPAYVTPAPPRI